MLSAACICSGFALAQATFPGVSNSSDSSMRYARGAFLYARETGFCYEL